MNRKFKTISAAILAAAMCASFAGCANSETSNNSKNESSKIENSTNQSIPKNSTGIKPESESVSDSTSQPEDTDKLPDITVAATDEILNADLNSGLLQFCNDVFQCGGYVTVAEFEKKYGSNYTFMYNDKPLDAENLSTPVKPDLEDSVTLYGTTYLTVTPNFTVNGRELSSLSARRIHLVNPTDKEIPLSDCYISLVATYDYPFYQDGFNEEITDVPEFLKSLGYEQTTISVQNGKDVKPSMEYNKKFIKDGYANYWFFEVGETNAFGARPFYKYRIVYMNGSGTMQGIDNIGYIFE